MVHLENQFHSSCLYCLMVLYLVLMCLVEYKIIQYLLFKTGNKLVAVECPYWIGTFLIVLCFWGIGFPLNLLLMHFCHLTLQFFLFSQFVDNLCCFCIFFVNTTSSFSNSVSFGWCFWSIYCLFSAFRLKSILSVWFFCFLVSINCGILFLTCLLKDNVVGAALFVWCSDVLYNNKNLFNSSLQSLFSAWAHWLTFFKQLLSRWISPFPQGE